MVLGYIDATDGTGGAGAQARHEQSLAAEQDLSLSAAIDRPNHVWAADITYIPMAKGFLYLVAVIDWASRAVLAWRLSNTIDTAFCLEALQEALATFGKPEIFNTDQGAQFTSTAFAGGCGSWRPRGQ